jgi:predicted RND superfamily exporter protein
LIQPATNAAATKRLAAEWPGELQREGVILSGWELLGTTVFDTVVSELPRVLVPIFLLVVVSLWFAFRSFKEVALSLGTLAFSGVLLWASMALLDWEWNILNMMALPLLLGMGVDYGIHIQLALRRYNGDLLAVRRSVGRALLLAGATTVAGFGSLAFSTNAGMASLGKVCALGILLALVTAVYLLPVWWQSAQPKNLR